MVDIQTLLGRRGRQPAHPRSKGIPRDDLHLPGPDFIDRVVRRSATARPQVLRNLQSLYDHGRLAGTGYLSILPVDQGIEHSAAASFATNPAYFDPQNIVELAIEGGCNAVASTFGVLGIVARRYAHRIPFIVKINHNELLTFPNKFDQIMFGTVEQACDLGAAGVGATIYFGSDDATRQIQEVSEAFDEAHELGLFTVLWCYLRNTGFKKDGGRLPHRRRPHRPGQPPRRHHRGRHHQAEAAGPTTAATTRSRLRQDRQARLRRADHRPPDRPGPLAGGQLLHGPRRADQLRRRVEGRQPTSPRRCAPRSSTSGPAASA